MHSSWDSEPISRVMTSSSILLSELRTYTHNARWSPPVCPAYTRHLRTARGSLLQRPADPPTPTSLLKPETLPLASRPLSNAFPVLSQWLSHLACTLSPRASPGGFSPRSPAPPTSRVGPSPRSCRLFFKAHPCHSARTPPSSVLCLLSKPSPLLQCDWFLLFFRPEVRPVNHCLITAVTITESLLRVRHGAPRYTLQGLSRPAPGSGVAPSCSARSPSVMLSHTRVPFRGNSRLRHARPCHDSPVT